MLDAGYLMLSSSNKGRVGIEPTLLDLQSNCIPYAFYPQSSIHFKRGLSLSHCFGKHQASNRPFDAFMLSCFGAFMLSAELLLSQIDKPSLGLEPRL